MIARARVDAFARAVDGAPTGDERLARLTALTVELRRLPDAAALRPDPTFRADLHARLVAEAEAAAAVRRYVPEQRRPAPTTASHGRSRRVLAGALAATLLGGTGAALASTAALPGELLYPVKRGVEQVRLGLSAGEVARGTTQLEIARTRLDEAELLVLRPGAQPEDTAGAVAAVEEFTVAAGDGTSLLLEAYRADGDDAHLETVATFLRDALPRLERLRADAPAEVDAAVAEALEALGASGVDLQRALASCGSACSVLLLGTTQPTQVRGPALGGPAPTDLPPAVAPPAVSPEPVVTGPVAPPSGVVVGGGLAGDSGVSAELGDDAGVDVGADGAEADLPGAQLTAPAPTVTTTVAVPLPTATVGDAVVGPGDTVVDPGGTGEEPCTITLLGECVLP